MVTETSPGGGSDLPNDDATSTPSPRVVVMGVTGSGKSTVGKLLAARLHVEFGDADDFHSPANLAKMTVGEPLTDEDRRPWLEAIGRWLEQRRDVGGVATCSALKLRYRDVLRAYAPDIWFLHVRGTSELLMQRMAQRSHHFMPASLLASQLKALEPPGADEQVVNEDIAQLPDQIVADFIAQLLSSRRPAVPRDGGER